MPNCEIVAFAAKSMLFCTQGNVYVYADMCVFGGGGGGGREGCVALVVVFRPKVR